MESNLKTGALPVTKERGTGMRQHILPDGRIRLIYDYWGPHGSRKVSKVLRHGATIEDVVAAEIELIRRKSARSLTSTDKCKFQDVVDLVLRQNNGAGMQWIYDRLKRDLAGVINNGWVQRYNRYIDALRGEGKAKNTIANHRACIMRCLNTAWKKSLINEIPIRDIDVRREFRDRVLTETERDRLETQMRKMVSPLYWSIRMMEARPIRKRDLWGLRRENLVLVGDCAPYIQTRAQKTAKSRIGTAIIPLGDLPEIVSYLTRAVPENCPYLFPRLIADAGSVIDFAAYKHGKWMQMIEPRRHFDLLLEAAGITDFHLHDLKRMATIFMLDHGYTSEDLLNLGFYASRMMIDKCYGKRSAMEILRKISGESDIVLSSSLKAAGER